MFYLALTELSALVVSLSPGSFVLSTLKSPRFARQRSVAMEDFGGLEDVQGDPFGQSLIACFSALEGPDGLFKSSVFVFTNYKQNEHTRTWQPCLDAHINTALFSSSIKENGNNCRNSVVPDELLLGG